MAALLSRRCIGTLGIQQGSSLALSGGFAVRGYAAAATATKQKPKAAAPAKAAPSKKPVSSPVTPKKPAPGTPTPKAAASASTKAAPAKKPASPAATLKKPSSAARTPAASAKKPASAAPPPKAAPTPATSAKKPASAAPTPAASAKKPAPPTPTPAPQKRAPEAPPTPKTTATKPATTSTSTNTPTNAPAVKTFRSGGMVYKVTEQEKKELTEEEQLEQIQRAMSITHLFPTRDPWGQAVGLYDVMIPYSTSLSERSTYSSWREMFEQFKENRLNAFKNFSSMASLASENGFPGIDLSGDRWYQKYLTKWPWHLASTTSVKNDSWLTSLRKSALDTYKQMNTAFAKRDDQTLKELTSSTYQDQIINLRKKQSKYYTYIWRFHKEVTPARVLSIRAAPGYLANDDPKFGNRMMVQALVRLDTEQSLEIYSSTGHPIHTPNQNRVNDVSAAEPRRVTEYFVFEKRMWYDGPWIIREQLWEAKGRKAAI